MKIITPDGFLQILKNKTILLDTNVFIDAFKNPKEFTKLFNGLKENGVVLVTMDTVLIEFTKGAFDSKKFEDKKRFVKEIIETFLPIDKEILDDSLSFVDFYKEEGKDVSVTDFILAGCLAKFGKNIFLMTKDIKDFPTNIFEMETYFNLFHRKAIHNYGIYRYLE